jgi:hypothetical protein
MEGVFREIFSNAKGNILKTILIGLLLSFYHLKHAGNMTCSFTQGFLVLWIATELGFLRVFQESILASSLGKTWQVAGSCKFLQDGRLSRI